MASPSDGLFGAGGAKSSWDLHLPTAYGALERWHSGRINALAVYCSDGRWGLAFDEFCHQHLHIPRYDRWAIPGGPAWLAMPAEDADLCRAIRVQLDFLVRVHELQRIVLITHHGCAWYSRLLQKGADECLSAQADDVAAAAAALRTLYPALRVETYLAMRRQDWISFHHLDTGERRNGSRTQPTGASGQGEER